MRKLLIFMAVVLGIWFYNNPYGKIGMSKPGFMVYSGVPTSIPILIHYKATFPSYQDKIINEDNELRLTDAIKETLADRMKTIGGFEYVVVGLGYGEEPFLVSDALENRISGYTVYRGNTRKMVNKYNKLKADGKKVLGIMVPNIRVPKISY